MGLVKAAEGSTEGSSQGLGLSFWEELNGSLSLFLVYYPAELKKSYLNNIDRNKNYIMQR